MFINLSNHPSETWQENQLKAARHYGDIVDIPFPLIDPNSTTEQVYRLALSYCNQVEQFSGVSPKNKIVVHVVGEPVFTFIIVTLLINKGYKVVASTTQRVSEQIGNEKRSVFKFVQFRDYQLLTCNSGCPDG